MSGHRVDISTCDSIVMLPPSFELLEMRWVLDRIAQLMGVEEKYDCEDDGEKDQDADADVERNEA